MRGCGCGCGCDAGGKAADAVVGGDLLRHDLHAQMRRERAEAAAGRGAVAHTVSGSRGTVTTQGPGGTGPRGGRRRGGQEREAPARRRAGRRKHAGDLRGTRLRGGAQRPAGVRPPAASEASRCEISKSSGQTVDTRTLQK